MRPRATSPAPSTSGRRSTRATPPNSRAAGTPPKFTAAVTRSTSCSNTPFGAGATPEAKKAALAAIEGLKAKKPISGPLKDNKGKVVIDKTYDNLDPFLDKMDYLLEGVVGSTT